jgi:hypothetical protein
MSHVDDGELTAYADGAYPVDDPVALRISAHLSTCGNCRTRLEQNHDLRARASEILAYASPVTREMPPFESLQTQLATSSAPRRRSIPLAWAATVIMALGLGWFGRGMWQDNPAMREVAMEDRTTAADVPVEATAQSAAPGPTAAPQEMAENTSPTGRRSQSLAKTDPAVSEADLSSRNAVGNVAGRAAEIGGGAGGQTQVAPTAGAAAAPAAPPPMVAPSPVAAEERSAVALQSLEVISAAESERRRLNLPRIPELPVARVLVGDAVSTVEQTLPDGNTISLMISATQPQAQMRSEARKSTAAAADAVARGAVVQVSGKTVTVMGNLPADSLRKLAAKVR